MDVNGNDTTSTDLLEKISLLDLNEGKYLL